MMRKALRAALEPAGWAAWRGAGACRCGLFDPTQCRCVDLLNTAERLQARCMCGQVFAFHFRWPDHKLYQMPECTQWGPLFGVFTRE